MTIRHVMFAPAAPFVTPTAAQSLPDTPGPAGDRYASSADPKSRGYWPGFPRRWAIGLELHHATTTGADRP